MLHTAYGGIGDMDTGGTEILGRDPATKRSFSRFYESQGDTHDAELIEEGGSRTWRGAPTVYTADFTENG